MSFQEINTATPAGTDKKKFGDDVIREFKEQTAANFQEVSNYPATAKPALRTVVWTTATRPSGPELVDRVTGYNTDLGCEEYYDLTNAKWITKGLTAWSVADRPASPAVGQYGYNTDLAVIERWSGSAWQRISGGRRGDIKMWSGSVGDIEAGWVLADGVQRTHPEGGNYTPPNLRNRFIVGAGSNYAEGATGGEAAHVLTISEMPSHNHTFSLNYNGVGSGQYHIFQPAGTPYGLATDYAGGGAAHNNMPPYYAMCFLYKI